MTYTMVQVKFCNGPLKGQDNRDIGCSTTAEEFTYPFRDGNQAHSYRVNKYTGKAYFIKTVEIPVEVG